MVSLKNCPFCGGKAVYSRIPGDGFSVLCTACGALAVRQQATDRDVLGAGWNMREVRHNFQQRDNVKPCPFCASRISIGKMPDDNSILQCGRCGMIVSFATSNDLSTTIQRWNRRAPGA